jgi:hypothetical protein
MIAVNDGRWHPGIGDPSVFGWVTVGGYLLAGSLCALCAIRASRELRDPRQRQFWTVLAVVMLALGINKQLDLQTWFTEVGRDMARAQGWYAIRHQVQLAFIAVLAVLGLLSQVWLYRILRDFGAEVRLAAVGLAFLTVFVVMRAASFHHADLLLGLELGGWLKVNALIELSGIGCVAWAAWRQWRREAPKRHTVAQRRRGPTSAP